MWAKRIFLLYMESESQLAMQGSFCNSEWTWSGERRKQESDIRLEEFRNWVAGRWAHESRLRQQWAADWVSDGLDSILGFWTLPRLLSRSCFLRSPLCTLFTRFVMHCMGKLSCPLNTNYLSTWTYTESIAILTFNDKRKKTSIEYIARERGEEREKRREKRERERYGLHLWTQVVQRNYLCMWTTGVSLAIQVRLRKFNLI